MNDNPYQSPLQQEKPHRTGTSRALGVAVLAVSGVLLGVVWFASLVLLHHYGWID